MPDTLDQIVPTLVKNNPFLVDDHSKIYKTSIELHSFILKCYNKILDEDMKPEMWIHKGLILNKLGKSKDALVCLNNALMNNENEIDTLFSLNFPIYLGLIAKPPLATRPP